MYRPATSVGGESEHSSDAREWATSASNNARRRAQNRVAQRNHSTYCSLSSPTCTWLLIPSTTGEKTKRRIEDLEAQLSLQTSQMSSSAMARSQSQQNEQPASKSPTSVNFQCALPELDAWMMNSSSTSGSSQSQQSEAVSPKTGSPVEFVDRNMFELPMFQQPQHPQQMEGMDTSSWADFASYLAPSSFDLGQTCQPNHTQVPQTMAPESMMFPGFDLQFSPYPADPFSDISLAPMMPQQIPDMQQSESCDTSVLSPHDRQEHILTSARAAGYSNFDAAVVDYYTGNYEEGSAVHQAQKASRSTRLRGVLGSLSRSAQRWPTSDTQGYHSEVRRAAEMLCMTDMAGLADNAKADQDGTKGSGKSGCGGERESDFPMAFQDKVSQAIQSLCTAGNMH